MAGSGYLECDRIFLSEREWWLPPASMLDAQYCRPRAWRERGNASPEGDQLRLRIFLMVSTMAAAWARSELRNEHSFWMHSKWHRRMTLYRQCYALLSREKTHWGRKLLTHSDMAQSWNLTTDRKQPGRQPEANDGPLCSRMHLPLRLLQNSYMKSSRCIKEELWQPEWSGNANFVHQGIARWA